MDLDARTITASGPSACLGSPDCSAHGTYYLHPGRLLVSADPTIVTTVLGSCVAVCLSDGSSVGGVNHYLLPNPVQHEQSPRFGAVAIPRLIEGVLASGGRLGRLEAKVFGGACVTAGSAATGSHLGAQNVRLAFQVLWDKGIPVVAHDVEGNRGRRITYLTSDGAATVWRL